MFDQNYIISAIDKIEMEQFDAEIEVMSALINLYEKEATFIEYASDEITASEYFQEFNINRALDKVDQKLAKKDNESLLKRILLFIPRAINRLIQTIRDKLIERKLKSFVKDIDILQNNLVEINDSILEDNSDGNNKDNDDFDFDAIDDIFKEGFAFKSAPKVTMQSKEDSTKKKRN